MAKRGKKRKKNYRTIYQKSVQRTLNDYNPTRDEHRRRASSTTNSSFDEPGDHREIDRLTRKREKERERNEE